MTLAGGDAGELVAVDCPVRLACVAVGEDTTAEDRSAARGHGAGRLGRRGSRRCRPNTNSTTRTRAASTSPAVRSANAVAAGSYRDSNAARRGSRSLERLSRDDRAADGPLRLGRLAVPTTQATVNDVSCASTCAVVGQLRRERRRGGGIRPSSSGSTATTPVVERGEVPDETGGELSSNATTVLCGTATAASAWATTTTGQGRGRRCSQNLGGDGVDAGRRAGSRGQRWDPASEASTLNGDSGLPSGSTTARAATSRASPARPPAPNKKSGLTVCWCAGHAGRVTTAGRPRACRRRSAPARCGPGCSRRPSTAWSSAASAGTSTTLVSERAGVSRGAQLHHFPTKNDLVVAAVEHLTEVRGAELAAAAARAADRAERAPARCCRCSATTSPRRSSPPRSSCGSPPAPTPTLLRRGRAARAAGRPRDAPAHRRAARRRRVPARRARAGAGHPRPGPRPRPGRHHLRRRPPARPDPRPVGATPSTTRPEGDAR